MTTSPHNPHTRRIRRGPSVLLLLGTLACALVVALPGGHATSSRSSQEALRAGATDSDELDGRDPRLMDSKRPKVEASFPAESYGPGSKARLVFVSSAKAEPARECVASPHGAGPDRQLAERTVLRPPDC